MKNINGISKVSGKNSGVIMLLCAVCILFFSCKSDDPVKNRAYFVAKLYESGTVKIAVEQSNEVDDTPVQNALKLAQKRIKAEKLCPVEIELVEFTDEPVPTSGMRTAYEICSDDEFAAVISYTISDIANPNSLIYQYHGLLMFNIISSSPKLAGRNNSLYFSNMPADTEIAEKAVEICAKNGFDRVLIYYLDSDYGMSLANSYEMNCASQNITIVNRDGYSASAGEAEHIKNIKRWSKNFAYNAVFLAGQMPEVQTIYRLMRENGIQCPVIGGDTFDGTAFVSSLDKSDNGKVFAVSNFDEESDNPVVQRFFADYMEEYGCEPDQGALQAYDALMVLAKAIASSNSAVPSELAESLRANSWDECAGPYSFDKTGSMCGNALTGKVYNDGKFKTIRQD